MVSESRVLPLDRSAHQEALIVEVLSFPCRTSDCHGEMRPAAVHARHGDWRCRECGTHVVLDHRGRVVPSPVAEVDQIWNVRSLHCARCAERAEPYLSSRS